LPLPDVESVRLRANGLSFHAVVAGPPDGPLVVLLHGFPEFWYGWRHQIGPLAAAGLRVLAPDQRGYNLSDKPLGARAYVLDRLADDVLGLVEALGHQRFAVVGHDWGGAVAWHLAGRNPERVERAAILNAPPSAAMRPYLRSHPSQMAKSWYMAVFQLPALPEALMALGDFAWLRRAIVRSARPGTFTPADIAHYLGAWRRPGALTAMVNWYRSLPLQARLPMPGRITVPVRIIWGDRDPFLETGLVDASLALCDVGEAFHLPDATHWVQHEEPDEVNRLLVEFLAPGARARSGATGASRSIRQGHATQEP
jgi:pimeloyl-ACP methyl ester carboxylesterase